MNQSEFEASTRRGKRGKTRASKSQLVLVWLPIGWENGADFANRSQTAVKQTQRNREITLDTQLKSALVTNAKLYRSRKQEISQDETSKEIKANLDVCLRGRNA